MGSNDTPLKKLTSQDPGWRALKVHWTKDTMLGAKSPMDKGLPIEGLMFSYDSFMVRGLIE